MQSQKPATYYRPSDRVYQVRYVPDAKLGLTGYGDDPAWSLANVERNFVFPWKTNVAAPLTEFHALCDDVFLYFCFRVEDADIVVLETLRNKLDILAEDRVELFFSRDCQMDDYYQLEIDSRGRVYDCHSSYYRQQDREWHWPGLETKAAMLANGYVVEGRMPLASFETLAFPPLRPGVKILCGLYRAEFSHDRRSPSPANRQTGVPPLEDWMSWIDPKTPTPDFHIPSSLGWLEIIA